MIDGAVVGGSIHAPTLQARAQVAAVVVLGVVEGVRGMLTSISPVQLSGQRNHALARTGGGGLFEGIFNSKKAALWRS